MTRRGANGAAPIERITATAAVIPTEAPEEDGTLAWDSTTLVVVEVKGGGEVGLGYTYASAGVMQVIGEVLAPRLLQTDALAIAARWNEMVRAVRNIGRAGIAACAISAIDTALWDLKAKLFGVSLVRLLGGAREQAAIYGSGGFTNLIGDALGAHVQRFEERLGCAWVKMKIGARPHKDIARIDAALGALNRAKLMVDANGAFLTPSEALAAAAQCAARGSVWLEEPLSSDDLKGLRRVREGAAPPVAIAAGETVTTPGLFGLC